MPVVSFTWSVITNPLVKFVPEIIENTSSSGKYGVVPTAVGKLSDIFILAVFVYCVPFTVAVTVITVFPLVASEFLVTLSVVPLTVASAILAVEKVGVSTVIVPLPEPPILETPVLDIFNVFGSIT